MTIDTHLDMLVVEQLQLDHDVGPQFGESLPGVGPAPQDEPAAERWFIDRFNVIIYNAVNDDETNLYS